MYRYFNQGYNGNGLCPGFGYFNHGWGFIAGIGLIITIALLFYLFVHNKKKRVSYEALEILKLQFVKGEISEEEYFKRKSILDR
jgi:Predicted membrane protein